MVSVQLFVIFKRTRLNSHLVKAIGCVKQGITKMAFTLDFMHVADILRNVIGIKIKRLQVINIASVRYFAYIGFLSSPISAHTAHSAQIVIALFIIRRLIPRAHRFLLGEIGGENSSAQLTIRSICWPTIAAAKTANSHTSARKPPENVQAMCAKKKDKSDPFMRTKAKRCIKLMKIYVIFTSS